MLEDVFFGSSVGSLPKIKNKKLQELEQSTKRLCTGGLEQCCVQIFCGPSRTPMQSSAKLNSVVHCTPSLNYHNTV